MQKDLGSDISADNIKDYLWKTLKSGQVVPGYYRSLHLYCYVALTYQPVMATVF
jgi:hypothetical protein